MRTVSVPMRIAAVMMLCCAAVLAADVSSLPQLPAKQVVARVNGTELYGGALNDYVKAVLPDFSFHGSVDPSKLKDYRRAALKRMVLHELIYQDGMRRHIKAPEAKVNSEIRLMQGRFRSPEDFHRSLARRGLTLEQLRNNIRRSLIIEAVVRRDVTAHTKVSRHEAYAIYRKHPKNFHEPATVKVSEIFIPAGANAAKRAATVRSQAITKNTAENFYQLATNNSKDDYRVMGGDRGWVHRGTMAPKLEAVAFALRPGQVSQPISTKKGIFILRVSARRRARHVPFSEVQKRIREQLRAKKKHRLVEALRARLYKNANVELLAKF